MSKQYKKIILKILAEQREKQPKNYALQVFYTMEENKQNKSVKWSDCFTCVSVFFLCKVALVCLLRYAQIIEHRNHCWLNTSGLVSGCTNAVGLVMVGNFQVSHTILPKHCFVKDYCLIV